MNKSICLFVFICATAEWYGQDIHWSQPASILIYQNPAFTGITGKYSLGINYRDQWNPINKSYKTYALSGDYRFDADSKKTNLSAGGMLYKDASADGSYIVYSGGITLSGQLSVNERSRFAAGLGFNFTQNRFNINQHTWGNQFDGEAYNPGLSTGEDQSTQGKTFSDLGAGISYIYHEKSGTVDDNNPDFLLVGYSAGHLNQPEISATAGPDKLNIKHTLMLTAVSGLGNNVALKPTILFSAQGRMMELTGGTLFRFGIGQASRYTGIRRPSFFSAGLLYRFKDALIPTFEFEKPSFVVGMSYDINLSRLSQSSKYRGGVEIYIRMKSPGSLFSRNKNTNAEDSKPSY